MSSQAGTTRRLEDKVVLVTGAGRGIGLAVADVAKREGATVVIADIAEETGQAAASSIGATFVKIDVSRPDDVAEGVDATIDQHGRIDVLVNNAGIALIANALATSVEDWDRIMSVDLKGVFLMSKEVGTHMVQRGSGAIVNVASIAAFIATRPEQHFAYDVAKSGVVQLSRTLAVEWATSGVRVNAVAPGRVHTPLTDHLGPEVVAAMSEEIPMKRWMTSTEIAESVVFLASDAASGITGHTLVVDGGFLAV